MRWALNTIECNISYLCRKLYLSYKNIVGENRVFKRLYRLYYLFKIYHYSYSENKYLRQVFFYLFLTWFLVLFSFTKIIFDFLSYENIFIDAIKNMKHKNNKHKYDIILTCTPISQRIREVEKWFRSWIFYYRSIFFLFFLLFWSFEFSALHLQ